MAAVHHESAYKPARLLWDKQHSDTGLINVLMDTVHGDTHRLYEYCWCISRRQLSLQLLIASEYLDDCLHAMSCALSTRLHLILLISFE